VHTKFELGNLNNRNHFSYTGVGGRLILRWILKKLGDRQAVDRIHLAEDMNQWLVGSCERSEPS
jgi:hypothetical protein